MFIIIFYWSNICNFLNENSFLHLHIKIEIIILTIMKNVILALIITNKLQPVKVNMYVAMIVVTSENNIIELIYKILLYCRIFL